MKWVTHPRRGTAYSTNGMWRIRNMESRGEDNFVVWRPLNGKWQPATTPNGKRTLARKTMASAKAYCEVEA